jgi:hypothetical protein
VGASAGLFQALLLVLAYIKLDVLEQSLANQRLSVWLARPRTFAFGRRPSTEEIGGAPDVRVTNRVLYVRPWMPCVRSCSTIQVWNSLCSLDRPRVVRPPDCEKSHTAFVDCKAAAILEYLDFRPAEALAVRGVLSAAARGR